MTGALVITLTAIVISVYLVSTFTLATLAGWLAGPSAWFAARGEAWREWRERAHQRAVEKAKAKAAARRAPVRAEKPRKEEEREPETTRRVAPLPSDVDGRAPWETGEAPQPAEYASVEEPSPRPGPPTPASKRFRSARWRNWRRCRILFPALTAPPKEATPHAHAASTRSSGCRRRTCSTRPPARNPLRRAGTEGHRQPHQGQVRRVQRAGQRGADQSRSGGHHLRIQARSRHQVQPHHQPHAKISAWACRPNRS